MNPIDDLKNPPKSYSIVKYLENGPNPGETSLKYLVYPDKKDGSGLKEALKEFARKNKKWNEKSQDVLFRPLKKQMSYDFSRYQDTGVPFGLGDGLAKYETANLEDLKWDNEKKIFVVKELPNKHTKEYATEIDARLNEYIDNLNHKQKDTYKSVKEDFIKFDKSSNGDGPFKLQIRLEDYPLLDGDGKPIQRWADAEGWLSADMKKIVITPKDISLSNRIWDTSLQPRKLDYHTSCTTTF